MSKVYLFVLAILIVVFVISSTVFATPVSGEEETESTYVSFQIPMNAYCTASNPVDLSFEVVNASSSSADITVDFYKKDGTSITTIGTNYDGIESTIIPGSSLELNTHQAEVYHASYGGQLTNCADRVYSGTITVNSGNAILLARGWVDSKRGSELIKVNNDIEIKLSAEGSTDPVDTIAPSAVSDLDAISPTSSTVTLNWSAPGDDGVTGTATSYDIRYSTSTITDVNWASATQVASEPSPNIAGTSESKIITGLSGGTTYYYALKTIDDSGNVSSISNNTSETTSEISYTSDLIPAMTSNIVPSGIVAYSAEYSGQPAYLAFNDVSDNSMHAWWSNTGFTTAWLSYEFPTATIVTKYTITSYAEIGADTYNPKSWTFEGWNGTTWVILDTRVDEVLTPVGVKSDYTFTNSQAYIKYRIFITDNIAGDMLGAGVVIQEMEMMGPG